MPCKNNPNSPPILGKLCNLQKAKAFFFKKLPMDPTHRHSRCLPDTKKSNDLRRCGFQKTDPFLLMVNTSALGSDLHQVIYKGCNLFLSFSNDRVSGNICFKNEGVLYVTKFICSNYHLLPQEMELLINAPEF